jgi:hypothetical protein
VSKNVPTWGNSNPTRSYSYDNALLQGKHTAPYIREVSIRAINHNIAQYSKARRALVNSGALNALENSTSMGGPAMTGIFPKIYPTLNPEILRAKGGAGASSFISQFIAACSENLRLLREGQCYWQGRGLKDKEIPAPGTRGFFPLPAEGPPIPAARTACGRLTTFIRPQITIATAGGSVSVDNIFFWAVSHEIASSARGKERNHISVGAQLQDTFGAEAILDLPRHSQKDFHTLEKLRTQYLNVHSPRAVTDCKRFWDIIEHESRKALQPDNDHTEDNQEFLESWNCVKPHERTKLWQDHALQEIEILMHHILRTHEFQDVRPVTMEDYDRLFDYKENFSQTVQHTIQDHVREARSEG